LDGWYSTKHSIQLQTASVFITTGQCEYIVLICDTLHIKKIYIYTNVTVLFPTADLIEGTLRYYKNVLCNPGF